MTRSDGYMIPAGELFVLEKRRCMVSWTFEHTDDSDLQPASLLKPHAVFLNHGQCDRELARGCTFQSDLHLRAVDVCS